MNTLAVTMPELRLSKKKLWLAPLLPLLFVSDILYGGMEYYGIELLITPGVMLRGGVLLVAVYMVLNRQRWVGRRLLIWIGLMVLSVLPSLVVGAFHGQSLFFDISALSKVLYMPLVTGLFVVLIRRYQISHDEILRYIEYAAYVLGISLLLSQQLGIAKQTYGDYAFGSTGIFHAQNDMTLAFGLALLSGGYRLVMLRFSWLRLVLLAMSAFACVQIGTRASLGVVAGTALTAVICMIWGSTTGIDRRVIERIKKWLIVFSILVVMVVMLFYSLSKQQEFEHQQQKLEQIAEGEFPRLRLVLAGTAHIAERSVWFDLMGEGTDAFQRGVAQHFPTDRDRRMVEVGWMDIFGGYGIGFTLLIHAFVLIVLLGSARRFLVWHDSVNGLIAAAALLYLGHSVLAGHALISPIPSTLMAGYFGIFFTDISACSRYRFMQARRA